jgi:hypothetical protein
MPYSRFGGVTAAAAAALLTASAIAAVPSPRPGHWHGVTSPRGGKDDEAVFLIRGHEIVRDKYGPPNEAIVAPTSFKCNEAFIVLPVAHVAIKHGRFAYHGPAVDTAGVSSTGITGTLDWTGLFTSRTAVKGTVRFRTPVTPVFDPTSYKYNLEAKSCDTGVLPWKGRTGRATGGGA